MNDASFLFWEKQRGVNGSAMRRTSLDMGINSSYDASWEEKAFAEDAAGPHGGCIWPPRSYSCNFCGREFRSAQALGGHMNVHRRDRARLKHSLCSQDVLNQQQPSAQLQSGSQSQTQLVAYLPSQACDLGYSPNPNPASIDNTPAPASLSLKISSPSITAYNISINQDAKQPWSKNLGSDRSAQTSNLMTMEAEKRGPQILKYTGEGALNHCDKPDIFVNLNLFLVQAQARKRSINASAEDDDGNYDAGSKRRKLAADESSTMSSSYIISDIVERVDVQQKLFPAQRSLSFIHDLDLELRLGDPPNLK